MAGMEAFFIFRKKFRPQNRYLIERNDISMEWMGVNDIRESFLSFLESKGHKRLPSFPLLPKDDKSLLLINSGMAPMKKWFLGQ